MKISPNFMKSLSNRYAKASMMNTLKENLEKRQEKTDDYFADMYNTAETKGLPAYEEASVRAKDLKRISGILRDEYDLTDPQILALAQRPTGAYGTGLTGIDKAIIEAKKYGKPLKREELLGLLETTEIAMPEGMTFEDAISKLAGIYSKKVSTDPNAKDEKNSIVNMLSSALSLNPKLDAGQLLENANIGGIKASDLFAQVTTTPSLTLAGFDDLQFTDYSLKRSTDTADQRLMKKFRLPLQALDQKFIFDGDNLKSGRQATHNIYAQIPDIIFKLRQINKWSEYDAEIWFKEKLKELAKLEDISVISDRVDKFLTKDVTSIDIFNPDVKIDKTDDAEKFRFDIQVPKTDESFVFEIDNRTLNMFPLLREWLPDLVAYSNNTDSYSVGEWEKAQKFISDELGILYLRNNPPDAKKIYNTVESVMSMLRLI